MTFIQGEYINRLTAEAPLCAILFGLGGISVMTFIQCESINRLLFIYSPCIKVITDIPPKPNSIAHRGASAISLFIDLPCIKVITDIPPNPNITAHRGASAVSLFIDSPWRYICNDLYTR
jgi:hypothetical protein